MASGPNIWTRRAWLLAALAVFVILRWPMVWNSAGQMDEQWFAVPGWTVWHEGIPRIPYCPTRRRETFFENADVCLFALPPGLHYVQAPFFGWLPAGYAAARLPSFLAGLAALVLATRLAGRLRPWTWVTGLSILMFAVSRPLMFTGITARPDLLCCVCGWGALLCMWHWWDQPAPGWLGPKRYLTLAGGLCGLGLLFHPFGLVACLQCGVWSLVRKGHWWQRVARGAWLALVAAMVLSWWLPLILRFPQEFQSQFMSNVLERSGPGLGQRLLWPWESLVHHARYQWEYNLPWQASLLAIGALLGTWVHGPKAETASSDADTSKRSNRRIALLLVWSSVYLTATVAGIHPTKGYWVYPIAMAYPLAVGGFFDAFHRCLSKLPEAFRERISSAAGMLLACGLFAFVLPGAGLTTVRDQYRYWGTPRVNASQFIDQVLQTLPEEGHFLVDVGYVFDVYLSGRDTRLCQPRARFWGDSIPAYDFLMIGREGWDMKAPDDYEAHFEKRFGAETSPADCFLDLYRPRQSDSGPAEIP